MGEPNRDPNRDPNRVPPATDPPRAPDRPPPASDPVGVTLGPILGTVSAQRPPNPPGSGSGTANQVLWDGSTPLLSGAERQTSLGITSYGGYVPRADGQGMRLFAGVSDGPTSLGFAGDQRTGAFALGLREGNQTYGVGLGFASNPQTQTQAGYLRLDLDRLQLTGQGTFAPAGNQYALDGRYQLGGGGSISAGGMYNDGTQAWRVNGAYSSGPGGTNVAASLSGTPQGVGGSASFDTAFGPLGSGLLRGGAQGSLDPNGAWRLGPRLNLEYSNGLSSSLGVDATRDAAGRNGARVDLGLNYTDQRSGARIGVTAGTDFDRGHSVNLGVTIPLDSIFGGGGRSRQRMAPPSEGDLSVPPPIRDRGGSSALQPQSSLPGDGAAAPRRSASANDAHSLLDGMIARDPVALAAARDQPAGQDLRAQAVATVDRQQAQQAQPTQQAALIADTPDAPANPSRGARSLS